MPVLARGGGGLTLFGRWAGGNPMPTGRSEFVAVEYDGTVYCIGGLDGVNFLGTVEAYDPSSGVWFPRASMPTPRAGAMAFLLRDGIHVVGGYGATGYLGVHEIYNPDTDTWSTSVDLPAPGRAYGAAVSYGGKGYVLGGYDGLLVRAEVYSWYVGASSWLQETTMPTPRYMFGADLLNHEIWTVGGSAANPSDVVERWNPVTGIWTTGMPMPGPRQDVQAVGQAHFLHVLGGQGYATDHYAFDTAKGRWTRRQRLPQGRDFPRAVAVGERIVLIGGFAGGVYLRRVDIYWPFGK